MTRECKFTSDSKTELVYIINSLYTGGAEVGMCRLLSGLDENKYNVSILALDGNSSDLIRQVPSWTPVVDLRLRSGIGIPTLKELYSSIQTADVIVGSLYHSTMIARLCRTIRPNVTIATWQHNSVFKNNFRKSMYKWTAQLSDAVLADSEPVAEMLITDLGLDPSLVHVVPIAGIDPSKYTSVEHYSAENITVGTVGRLTEQKNYAMVLGVAERLEEMGIRFEIVGDGEMYDTLQSEIDERDLQNVTLNGFVEDLPSFLTECDIYFQPSRWEGLCITVLEAMAAGLPVVGSNVGGIGRNVKADASGFLCEPDDVDGFVTGIKTLVGDPDLRQKFGEQGKEIVGQNFTQKVLVDEFERAISTD